LLQFSPPEQVLIYLSQNKIVVEYDNSIKNCEITPQFIKCGKNNGTCKISNDKLYNSIVKLKNVPNETLGLTILLTNFAYYASHGAYHLFISEFQLVDELNYLECFLYYENRRVKVDKNFIISEDYGLKKMHYLYNQKEVINVSSFMGLINYLMKEDSKTSKKYLFNKLKTYHVKIVESIYVIITDTISSADIVECRNTAVERELNLKKISFDKKKTIHNSIYWFEVPKKATWFAYKHDGYFKFFGFVSRYMERLIVERVKNRFKDKIVIGLATIDKFYIVQVLHCPTMSNFKNLRNCLQEEFNDCCIFVPTLVNNEDNRVLGIADVVYNNKKIYFVESTSTTLFKYS